MRNKKPMNNYGQKRRYDNSGQRHGGGGQRHSGGSPRKNWPTLREKYMAQARDAMAGGDRVLAENFLQHADHCWRMMMEEGSHRPRQPQQSTPATDGAASSAPPQAEENPQESGNALPAFITTPYGQPKQGQPAPVQNWEERDAE